MAFTKPETGRKIKVLLAGPVNPPTGGIQTVLKDTLASSLDNKVELVHFDSSKRTAQNRSLWQGIKAQLAILRDYRAAIRKHKPDLVHVYAGGNFDTYRKCFDVLVARLMGRKVIFHNHSGNFNEFWESRGFLGRTAIRFALRRCTRVLVLSDWWKEFHAKIVPPERISVVYNGIEAGPYERNVHYGRARHMLGIPRDRVMVLMMGVMGKRKGAFDIVASAPFVAKMEPSVLFVLVGPDEDVEPGATERLRKEIAEKNLQDMVQLRGPASEQQRHVYYAAADVFLLPSYAENSPMTIIEAMASKLPVISTKVGAIPEMVDHERTGLIVSPGRCSEITEAVIALVKDHHLRREMGQEGFRKFRHMFDMERVAAPALWQVYRECATGKAAQPESGCGEAMKDERAPVLAGRPARDERERARATGGGRAAAVDRTPADRFVSTADDDEPMPADFTDSDDDAPSAVELIQAPPEDEVRFDDRRYGHGRGRYRSRRGASASVDDAGDEEVANDDEVIDDGAADDEVGDDQYVDEEVADDESADEAVRDEAADDYSSGEESVKDEAAEPADDDSGTDEGGGPAGAGGGRQASVRARPEPEHARDDKIVRSRSEFGAGILDAQDEDSSASDEVLAPEEDSESDRDDETRIEVDENDADEEGDRQRSHVDEDEIRGEGEDVAQEGEVREPPPGNRPAEQPAPPVTEPPAAEPPAAENASGAPAPENDADQEEADKRAQDALDRLDDE
ncbi:MAG TPA: glycosyltransferase [Planctomycetota bacterium]|nr:glycosyltransferase [Planctomycetota bacterium]